MGDRCGEFSHRRKARHPGEFFPSFAKRLNDLFTFCQITHECAECPMITHLHRRNRQLDLQLMSVFMETCDFDAFVEQWAFACGKEASHSSLVRCSISRRNYFIDQPLSKYLRTRPSKYRLRLFVPTRNYAIGVHDDDCFERAIDDKTRSLFCGLKPFLRNFEFLDIGTSANKSKQISFRIVHRDSVTKMPVIGSIGMADGNFIGPPSARLDTIPK